VLALDDLTGSGEVRQIRQQMLDAHQQLLDHIQTIQGYTQVASGSFTTYGSRAQDGLASMMMFGDLFNSGLATLGSTQMNSFDFHATDALRTPTGDNGNMLTETAQALAGTFFIARQAFAAKRDAIVHFSTCSNRSIDWTQDDGHVSTITFIIKGSGEASAFRSVPATQLLITDGASNMYAEAPSGTVNYSGADADHLGMTGDGKVGSLEGGIVAAVGTATGQTPAISLAGKPAKII
jgi:hypothetical protein